MKFFKFVLLFVFINFTSAFSNPKDSIMYYLGEVEYVKASTFINAAMSNDKNKKDYSFNLLCGDIYLELEKIDSAYIYYKKAEDLEDDKPEVLRKVGRVESLKGNYQAAVKILEKAIEEDKKSVDSYLELADAHIRDNNLKDAEIVIGRAKRLNEKEPRIYTTLGDMYFAQRVFELAKNNYEQALSIDSENQNAMMKLAESYYRLANQSSDTDLANEYFGLALKQYNQVTQRDGKNAKALFEQGKILFWSKRYEDAAKILYPYAQLRPEGSLGRWFLAQSLVEIGKCDSASIHLKYASENIDTIKVKAQVLLAQCYYNDKNYIQSSNSYDKIFKDTVFSFADYRRYATAKLFAGDTVNSVSLYKEVLNKYPEDGGVCSLTDVVGKLMLSIGNYNDAKFFLEKRVSETKCSDSTDSKVYFYLGLSKLNIYNTSAIKDSLLLLSAMGDFEKSIKLDSNYVPVYSSLGDCYILIKKDVEADKIYNLGIQKGINDLAVNSQSIIQAFGKLCGMKLETKNYKELIKVSQKWTTALPNNEYGWLYNAIGHQGNGDKNSACSSYNQVLKINPENAGAKKNKSLLGC